MHGERKLQDVLAQLPLDRAAGSFHRIVRLQYLLDSLVKHRRLGVLDAIGSRVGGGRYNVKGRFEALYVAADGLTANLEAASIFGPLKSPIVHVGVAVTLHRILDLTRPEVQLALGTERAELSAPWRMIQESGGEAPTQLLGRIARSSRRVEGLLYFSTRNPPAGRCLAIFPDRITDPSVVDVVDDSGRLKAEHLPRRRR